MNVASSLGDYWWNVLFDWSKLSEDEQNEYLRKSGHETLRDLLVYVCTYWAGTFAIVDSLIRKDISLTDTNDLQPTEDVRSDSQELATTQYETNLPTDSKDLSIQFLGEVRKFTRFIESIPKHLWMNQSLYYMLLSATVILYEEKFPLLETEEPEEPIERNGKDWHGLFTRH